NDDRRCDHVIVNDNPEDLTFAHLVEVFRCKPPNESLHNIGLINMLTLSKWVPKTKWAGCRNYEEKKATRFIMLKYLVHGMHMIPVFDVPRKDLKYLNDIIDGDMF
ncbi:hypothetical protein B0H17DRAFT_887101, partial [Mycena rosella]